MAIADLKSVLKIFGGSDIGDDERNELYKEVLLMTLSRAADADINIQAAEVDRVREILKEHTGEEFSSGDVRVAAREELYASASLVKYLSRVRSKMAHADRVIRFTPWLTCFAVTRRSAYSRSIFSMV